jgi:hypothetical protein
LRDLVLELDYENVRARARNNRPHFRRSDHTQKRVVEEEVSGIWRGGREYPSNFIKLADREQAAISVVLKFILQKYGDSSSRVPNQIPGKNKANNE